MAIDFNARPAGMSKREYAASILGGSKENFSSNGQPKSVNSSSPKVSSSVKSPQIAAPKPVKYTDLVDVKPLEKSFDAAKNTYLETLTALKPRYEALYAQLEAEKGLAKEKEVKLAEQEATQQKVDIAKRGIATDTSNSFFTSEASKLADQQNLRSRETDLAFAGKRLDISGAESADTKDITTAIANLDLTKANTIQGLVSTAKQSAANLNAAAADRAIQQAQWEKTFEYTKSKDAADRALELYKFSKSQSTTKNDSYNTTLAALYSDAMSPKDGIIAPYTRERIKTQLELAFPEMKNQIAKDIAQRFPNGWESQANVSQTSQTNSTAQIDLLTKSINNAIELSDAAGRSGARRKFEDYFIGSTDFTDLVAETNTIRTNILSMMTDPNIKKFFGPQMSNADVQLMTSAGTTLNPENQTPEKMREELARLKDLVERANKAVSQATSGVTSSGMKYTISQ